MRLKKYKKKHSFKELSVKHRTFAINLMQINLMAITL